MHIKLNGEERKRNAKKSNIFYVSFFFYLDFRFSTKINRIMALNLLNLYSLIFALFDKVGSMNKIMDEMRISENVALAISALNGSDTTANTTDMTTLDATATTITDSAKFVVSSVANAVADLSPTGLDSIWDSMMTTTALPPNCRQVEVNCTKPSPTAMFNKSMVTSLAFLTTTILPEILTRLNVTSSPSTYDYFDSNSSSSNMTTMNDTLYDWWDGNSSTPINFNSTAMGFENFTEGNDIETIWTTTEAVKPQYDEEDGEDYDYDVVEIETTKKPTTVVTSKTTTTTKAPDYDEYLDTYQDRRKRETSNVFDVIQSIAEDYDDNDVSAENRTFYYGNFSDFVSSFMENNNITVTIDDWNVTEVSEMWTTFVNDIDESTWTTEETMASSGGDDVLDGEDADEDKICYEIVCDASDSTGDDYTTSGMDRTTTTEPVTTTMTPFTCPTLPTLAVVAAIETANASKTRYIGQNLTAFINHMELSQQTNLRKLCWETMFGQELVKLTVMDLVATITSVMFMDFFRALFVRFMNKCWCWDLEKKFPKVSIE